MMKRKYEYMTLLKKKIYDDFEEEIYDASQEEISVYSYEETSDDPY